MLEEEAMFNFEAWYCHAINSISAASDRSLIENLVNAWAIHTPSLLLFYHGLLVVCVIVFVGRF